MGVLRGCHLNDALFEGSGHLDASCLLPVHTKYVKHRGAPWQAPTMGSTVSKTPGVRHSGETGSQARKDCEETKRCSSAYTSKNQTHTYRGLKIFLSDINDSMG